MSNVDPVKPINGKKLILTLGVGAVVFTAVMGFGTYWLANKMTPILERNAPKYPSQGAMRLSSPQKS